MTLGQVDYVLFRPWLPREQFLYLPVSEFLAAWEKSLAPSPEAIQIIGRRWLEQAGEDGRRLPVVLFRRGRALADPTDAELAEALGFGTRPVPGGCDVLIVGAGP